MHGVQSPYMQGKHPSRKSDLRAVLKYSVKREDIIRKNYDIRRDIPAILWRLFLKRKIPSFAISLHTALGRP